MAAKNPQKRKSKLKSRRILFIGGTLRGFQTLSAMIDQGFPVAGILSLRQDPHEKARFEQQIRQLARTHSLPLVEAKTLNSKKILRWIKNLRPDAAIVVGCRVLIPDAVYRWPRLGCFAAHDSLLPEYRGFAPLNWAVINGERKTGVTLFKLNREVDQGIIYAQKSVKIKPDETAPEIYKKICEATAGLVLQTLRRLERGRLRGKVQRKFPGSYGCPRIPADGLIEWNNTTRNIYNFIRALADPYPGAFVIYRSKRVYIRQAKVMPDSPRYAGRIPGRPIVRSVSKGYVDVLTSDGILRLLKVQVENDREKPAAKVFRSVKINLNFSAFDMLETVRRLKRKMKTLSRG